MANTAQAELLLKVTSEDVVSASKNMDRLARATADVGKQYQALTRDQQNFARTSAAIGAGFTQLSRAAQTAFGTISGAVGGFITAGMQGTAESYQLGQALKQINLQIASVFTPTIHKA